MTDDYKPISIFERRRRAPFHFLARADNARFSAYLLSTMPTDEGVTARAASIGYGGTPSIALTEAFNREPSIALELVIKAVIAQRLEVGHDLGQVTKVPANHNVPHLWVIAGLPQLPPEDSGRLVIARVYLMWANRYPAPNRDEDGYRDDADLWRRAHVPVGAAGNLKRRVSFAWDDVNRLYKIADRSIWDIRKCAGLSD